jgi:hypothetical protein
MKNGIGVAIFKSKKQGRPGFPERPRSAALLARSLSPLPVPTGGSDFPPEPSATWAVDEFECLHLPQTDSLQI